MAKVKSPLCRKKLHAMDAANIRFERVKSKGRRYLVRRCKACQHARWKSWFYLKRRTVTQGEVPC